MAKQLNVNVQVTADTAAAKAQLQQLQQSLNQLTSNSANLKIGLDTTQLKEASTMVDQLAIHLKNATNTNTGTLDFTKLSTSIKASGSSLTEYGNQLLKLGPQGQQAFTQLTQAIAKSEVPMNRMKSLLGEFGTVLTNTIRWQAASSAIHGMMGSIQHAFSYAQQLNESLNRIQIVTQASDDYMAQFAEQANKAAKALSTTTTAYTNASLIYYQQGLSDKEVAARTEVTIKMANASGQSAEKVSNQMTAIWNNFAEGSTNLEYYADVITALGAATASSSEEIATGLQKFASVADTVGLSYENATAALATITATTRQSADTVGTGLRTLFARLQSLNLGETLDDGVTLTKYSKALEKIGVDVLDMSGNLRSADDILADMGSKWQDLTSAQKTAVAQTVGGVRQYTTIMALMENFDEYQRNIQIATNSEGTVQAQADIYAKSWEAAQKRVKAASESLYSDLIDDKFFIALNDGFAGFLNLLDQIIDGFGGLKTLLPGIIGLLTNLFSSNIATGMVNFTTALSTLRPGYSKQMNNERTQFLSDAAHSMAGIKDDVTATTAQKVQLGFAEKEIGFQQNYAANQAVMSQNERQLAQMYMDRYSNLRQSHQQAQRAVYDSSAKVRNLQGSMVGSLDYYDGTNYNDIADNKKAFSQFTTMEKKRTDAGLNSALQSWFDDNNNFSRDKWLKDFNESGAVEDFTAQIDTLESKKNIIKELFENGTDGLTDLMDEWDEKVGDGGFKDLVEGLTNDETGELDRTAVDEYLSGLTKDQTIAVQDFAAQWGLNENAVKQYSQAIIEANGNEEKLAQIARQIQQTEEQTSDAVAKRNAQIQTAQNITKVASAVTSGIATMNSFSAATQNIVENIQNGDSVFKNFTSTLSGAASGLMSFAMIMQALPGPWGIVIGLAATFIGILSQIPEVQDLFNRIFKSDETIAIEKATALADSLGTSFEDAKEKADNFLEAANTHNQLLEEINKLTTGTNEFKNAVIEANGYVRQMLSDYGLTLDDLLQDENGVLSFKPGVIEQKQMQLEAERDNLEAMTTFMNDYYVPKLKFDQAQHHLEDYQYYMDIYDNPTENGKHKRKDSHSRKGIQDVIDEYNNQNEYTNFEEYVKARGIDTRERLGDISYNGFKSAITGMGYKSIDDYIEATKLYGENYSDQAFGDIISDYFVNLATTKVLGEGKNLNISKHLADFLANTENKYFNPDDIETAGDNEIEQALQDGTLKDFLIEKLGADAVKELKTDDQLRTAAKAWYANEAAAKIFDDAYTKYAETYEDIENDVLNFSRTKNKNTKELSELTQKEQLDFVTSLQSQLEQTTDPLEKQVLEDYLKDYETYHQDISNRLANILGKDTLSAKDRQEYANVLDGYVSALSIDNKQLNEIVDLQASLKDIFGDAFNSSFFYSLFNDNELDNNLMAAWRQIDLSSKVSTLFSLKDLTSHMGDNNPLKNYFNGLYKDLYDEIGGKTGIFSEIFGEEKFQEELKDVQKEFKKTGKISSKNIKNIADACDDLDDALENNTFSIGAVADALELYSEGAIDSIDSITEELWNALDAANAFSDALEGAFDWIDSFNPDRSITDIDEFFSNTAKDYFSELGSGTTGSNRLYQDAAALFNQEYANQLKSFFYMQEGQTNQNNPWARQAAYDAKFGEFDAMWEQVQSSGNLQPFWQFMLSGKGNELYGRDVSGSLAGLGLKTGTNPEDIEWNMPSGMTSDEAVRGLMSALGIDEGAAQAYFSEIAGHSAAIATDFQVNDFLNGAGYLLDENGNIDTERMRQYAQARGNDLSPELIAQSLANQYGIELDENGNLPAGGLGDAMAQAKQAQLERRAQELGVDVNGAASEGQSWDDWLKNQTQLSEEQQKELDRLHKQAEAVEANKEQYNQLGEELETQKEVKEDLAAADQILFDENGNIISGLEEGTAAYERVSEAAQKATIKQGEFVDQQDSDKLISQYKAMGMTAEQAFQTAKDAADKSGKQMTHSWTDRWGNVQQAIIENANTAQEYLEKCSEAEAEAAEKSNKLFGKQLFSGMIEGLQELGEIDLSDSASGILKSITSLAEAVSSFDGSPEKAQALKDSIEAFTNIGDATIPDGLATGITDLITALKTGDGAEASATSLKTALETLKEALGTSIEGTTISAAITSAMNTLITALAEVDKAAEQTDEKAEKLEKALERLRKAMAEYSAASGGSGFVECGSYADQDTGSGVMYNEQNSGLVGSELDGIPYLPVGFTSGPSAMGAIKEAVDAFDFARDMGQDYKTMMSQNDVAQWFAQQGGYDLGTDEGAQKTYNAMSDALASCEIKLADGSIQAIGEATGDSVQDAMQPSGSKGNVVNYSGDNKVTVDGKDYNLGNTNYDSKVIENMVANLAAAQKTAIDGSASTEERANAQSQVDQLTAGLNAIISDIQNKVTPEPSNNNAEGGSSKGEANVSANVTEVSVGDASVQLQGEVTELDTSGVEGEEVTLQGDVELGEGLDTDSSTIAIDGDNSGAIASTEAAVSAADSASGEMTINGDNGPAINAVNAAVAYANGSSGTIRVSANTNDAVNEINKLDGMAITVNVSVNASALGEAVRSAAEGSSVVQELAEKKRKHLQSCNDPNHNWSATKEGSACQYQYSNGGLIRSYVNGSANRSGPPGIALTGEEGAEIVWNKQEGYAYIVGANHPQFVNLKPGDRVFNANDTRKILNYDQPKSNWNSMVVDPSLARGGILGSYAGGSAYGSYGPQSSYGSSGRSKSGGSSSGDSGYQSYKPNRYHLVERQIQDLTFWYDELSKAKDKAYGTNRLRFIEKEIQATDELVKANQALLKEAQDYYNMDLAKLDELGINYELDEAGNIKNYDELQEQYRKVAETSDDDAAKDAAQEAWDAIEQYEETLDKLQEVKAELSDQLYDYADLRLEKITLKAELRVDFDDKEIDFAQHFIDKMQNNIYKTSETLGKMGTQMGLINDKLETSHNAINEIFSEMTDAYGNKLNITYDQWLRMSEAEREALNINGDYGKQLEEYAKDIQDYIEALEDYKMKGVEALTAAFDELNTAVTDQISLFDHYSSMLSSLRDITDLQNIKLPKEFRDTIRTLNKTMVDVSKDRIKSQQDYYNELNNEANALQDKINNTSDYDLKKAYQEQLDDIKSQMRDTMEDVLSTYQDALSKAKELYDETMEWIKEDYESSLSDLYNSTSLIQDAFDRKKALSEQYVDDYEKYYQLGKLQRQINKDIDNAAVNGNKANKNLKKLLEEIQTLQENGAQLSAYDLDILSKKYEYEKALADLEDARNAKQTVRLQRDRNGNWGYVYTAADGDELAEQEQAVEDKLYEYTKAATDQSKDLQSQILSLWAEAGDKIAQMRADGVSEDVIDDYIADTQQKLSFLMAQLEKTGTDVSLYLPKWLSLTNDSFNLTTDTFKETILSMVTGMDNIGQVGKKISDAIITITDATREAVEQYNITIDALNKLVSGNSNFKKQVEEWARSIGDASKENVKNTKEALDNMHKTFNEVLTAAKAFEKEFMTVYEPIIKRNEDFLSGLLAALDALNKKTYGTADLTNSQKASTLDINTSSGTSSSSSGLDDKTRFMNFYYGGAGNLYNSGHLDQGVMDWLDDTYNYYKQLEGIYGKPNSYDTGGYTGAWGSGGKLAVLHEKEEVFNKHDTENLLTAANILRTLDMQTGNFERGLGEFFNPSVKDNKQTLEQEVYITAEFPNATSHSEIEEAFNNLANRATQYANRKVG